MWRSFWRRQLQAEPSTDDDCDSDSKHSQSYRERRREAHTAAEQKRRDAIKKGYDTLQELVPTCTQVSSCFISESVCLAMIDLITFIPLQTDASGHKVSKAVVLQKSIDFIQHLSKQKKSQENDLTSLRKEVNITRPWLLIKTQFQVVALQIMRANYEQLVRAHMRAPQIPENLVADETKFQVVTIFTWLENMFKTKISGVPSVHGLAVPVI